MTTTTNLQNPRDAVIVQAIRTPLCRARKGGLAKVPPSTLLSAALRGVLLKDPQTRHDQDATDPASSAYLIPPSDVQDICVGNVLSPPTSAVSFRMAALSADIPHTTSLSTTNRQCSSGLQAIANIAHAIQSGSISIGIGAGVESMSSDPMHELYDKFPPQVDWEVVQNCRHSRDAMGCLIPMGVTSENVSKKYRLDRSALDRFAAESHRKAARAQSLGKFRAEITPVGDVSRDDGIRPDTTAETLSKLKPVFDKAEGSTTAGNSSQLTDGAAAVLLMSREEAVKRKLPIWGVWRSYAVEGVPPDIMGVGPVYAIPSALQKAKIGAKDVDIFEINEAFASQAYYCIRTLKLEEGKVNPNGGAIALGHPLGCTGARMVVTLLNEMRREGKRWGVVSMCVGTGMGAAAVLEVECVRS
eukprot:CAMPEP_0171398566 /NCGR_PEP_ID=MMETSP0880-20121228/6030_1 /TAXON_ID=67004 /ORGANISM="Thalassiosira weissflogii, Strain CCMP1336" /LENGTH=414 /DNA_ID=CAMNT_0011912593 /DNA_START=26 /DNA_END=1267 /DNA_ORIENTATION=-